MYPLETHFNIEPKFIIVIVNLVKAECTDFRLNNTVKLKLYTGRTFFSFIQQC